MLSESQIKFEPTRKFSLNLANYMSSSISTDQYGTFMIFHENIPRKVISNGGYLATEATQVMGLVVVIL